MNNTIRERQFVALETFLINFFKHHPRIRTIDKRNISIEALGRYRVFFNDIFDLSYGGNSCNWLIVGGVTNDELEDLRHLLQALVVNYGR